ncbi:MAG: DUF502 domain-containing protein [Bacteriovoracaceae bacterium]|jgi:uncharacterized membrane protein|nr:DUF502 domain-containing protein [Bacteriovoracaceae bacterium]
MGVLNRLFLKGLITVVPITVTLYLILAISSKLEGFFAPHVKKLLGPTLYIPGFGIVVTIILIILVGVLVSNFVTGSIFKVFIKQFEKVPFIKAIYNPLKDLMSLFAGNSQSQMQKVVMVKFEHLGIETIGLVTREDFEEFNNPLFSKNKVAVYIPLSYMLGGFTAIVSRENLTEIDIPVDKAFKLAITGWITSEK